MKLGAYACLRIVRVHTEFRDYHGVKVCMYSDLYPSVELSSGMQMAIRSVGHDSAQIWYLDPASRRLISTHSARHPQSRQSFCYIWKLPSM